MFVTLYIRFLPCVLMLSTSIIKSTSDAFLMTLPRHPMCSLNSPALVCTSMVSTIPTAMQINMAPAFHDASIEKRNSKIFNIANVYCLSGIASALAWVITACVSLSFHPDPKFMDCTLRHNILTMSQAFAFPVPIAWACFEALRIAAKNDILYSARSHRLNLGVAAASLWLAASSAFAPKFAFGYDLYSLPHKIAATAVHTATGMFALNISLRSASVSQIIRRLIDSLWKLGPNAASESESSHRNSALYATGSVGLLYFTILPIVSPFPLATIPTILGKRLSRPASAFTLLGAIVAYSLKLRRHNSLSNNSGEQKMLRALRKGLAVGSASHLLLIFLKLIGVDGGGWVFRGRGLWEVYPALISVPFAAGVSMAVHGILCLAAFSKDDDSMG